MKKKFTYYQRKLDECVFLMNGWFASSLLLLLLWFAIYLTGTN